MLWTYGEFQLGGFSMFYETVDREHYAACKWPLEVTRQDGVRDLVIFRRVHIIGGRVQEKGAAWYHRSRLFWWDVKIGGPLEGAPYLSKEERAKLLEMKAATEAFENTGAAYPAIGSQMTFNPKWNYYDADIVPGSVVTVIGLGDEKGTVDVLGPCSDHDADEGEAIEHCVHISELSPIAA